MSWRIKSVVACWVLVLSTCSFADSPVVDIQKSTSKLKTAAAAPHFIFPTPTLIESDLIETGVMFVYSEHILEYFGGDTQKLVEYVDASIAHNNQAFINSNIPIKRVVTGLVYVQADNIWSADDAYIDRLHGLAAWQLSAKGKQLKQQHQYSYLVSLAGFAQSPNEATMLGQAFVGENVSWVSPFSTLSTQWLERTLAHELSHNDGFKHANEGQIDEGTHIARFDAAGYQCGAHASIMYVSGLRTQPFFSDADISISEKQSSTSCGVVGQANAAQVYRDLLTTTFAKRSGTFSNIQPTRSKTGVVSIHASVPRAVEGQNIQFDIIFEGADAGDSVNIIARRGSADLQDFHSQIVTLTHDGVNNVYSVSMPTKRDSAIEEDEYFTYALMYPNGVTIDESKAFIELTIIDEGEPAANVTSFGNLVEVSTSSAVTAPSSSAKLLGAAAPSANNPVGNGSEKGSGGGSFSLFLAIMLMLAGVNKRHKRGLFLPS